MLKQLYLPKWSIVLLTLYSIREPYRYCQKIYKNTPPGETPVASSHVRNVLTLMEINGFITREKKGRTKPIVLTVKGEQVAKDILKLKQDLSKPLSAFETG